MRIPPDASYSVQEALREIDRRLRDIERVSARRDKDPDNINRGDLESARSDLVKLIDRSYRLQNKDAFRGSGPTHAMGHVPDTRDESAWDERVLSEAGWVFPFRGMIRPVTNLGVLGSDQLASDILQILASVAITGRISAAKAHLGDLEVLGDSDIRVVGARIWHSSNQNGSQGTAFTVSFDSVSFDTGGLFDSADPTKLTVPAGKGGKYLVSAAQGLTCTGSSTYHLVQIRLDGSSIACVSRDYGPTSTSSSRITTPPVMMDLSAGQYVECMVYADGTGTLTALPAEALSMWMIRIGV